MKKTLMLVSALVTMLFVGGAFDILPVASAQEVSLRRTQHDTTVAESSDDASITADSTNGVGADDVYLLVYLNIADTPRIDSIFLEIKRVATSVADSTDVAEEPAEEVASDKRYQNKLVKWGGRDRYGRFTDQCAAHVNGRLKRAGYYSQGHAYQSPYYFPSIINGYTKVEIPDLSQMSAERRFSAVLNMGSYF